MKSILGYDIVFLAMKTPCLFLLVAPYELSAESCFIILLSSSILDTLDKWTLVLVCLFIAENGEFNMIHELFFSFNQRKQEYRKKRSTFVKTTLGKCFMISNCTNDLYKSRCVRIFHVTFRILFQVIHHEGYTFTF